MPSAASRLALLALWVTQATIAGALPTGEYLVINSGRAGCSTDVLGFNNRSCSAGTTTRPAGPGVGPSLRAATAANTWTTFAVTVTKELPGGAVEAVLSTFAVPGGPQPRCMGNLVAEKAAACADPRAHIHPAAQAGAGVPWVLAPVGNGAHTISYSGRADGCATHLTASAACGTASPFLAPADGSPLQEWVLEPVNPAPSPSPPPPPPPLAGQPPSLTISSIEATSAMATIAPPRGGCTPVSYVVSHARANSLDVPARTAVPAAGALTARLGNLGVGVEYEATAVGVCADGTVTPPSAPATFTTIAPRAAFAACAPSANTPCGGCIVDSLTTVTYRESGGKDTKLNITAAISNVTPSSTVTCWASNLGATVDTWTTWAGVAASSEAPCEAKNCVDAQTASGSGMGQAGGTATVVIPLWIRSPDVDEGANMTFSVVCSAMVVGGGADACSTTPPHQMEVIQEKTCFPADAVAQRVNPSTGATSPARMDELAIGDYVECLVPQSNATRETGYTYGTCQVYYYVNKGSAFFQYYFFSYAALGGAAAVFRASPRHDVFLASAASGLAAAPPPGAGSPSESVQVGDLLVIQDPATKQYYTTPVTAITMAGLPGAYTPLLTNAGLMVVDGVVAYTHSGRANPLKQQGQHWMAVAVWQAFLAGNASACAGDACPCLDGSTDTCVRQGTLLSDLPDRLSSWYTEYTVRLDAARGQGRTKVNYAGLIAEASTAVANGTVFTRAAALDMIDNFYTA